MPSRLRQQTLFEPFTAESTSSVFPAQQPPAKKQKMSLSQTYYVASSARAKLSREASRPDHNLRLLVGHANLLDTLMVELQDAEREQERWFHQTVQKAQKTDEPRHIQWVDTIVEEDNSDDESDADSDVSDSDSEYEGDFEVAIPLRRLRSPPVSVSSRILEEEDEDDEEYYDDMEDAPELALTRIASQHSPPELVEDSESDDESPPTSPPQAMMDFSFDEKHSLSEKEQAAFVEHGYFIPERNAPMIAVEA